MNDNLKPGDKIKVPRTGGGYSDGEIVDIYKDRARVSFPVGETFRGEPIKPEDEGRTAYKEVALKDLMPFKEESPNE